MTIEDIAYLIPKRGMTVYVYKSKEDCDRFRNGETPDGFYFAYESPNFPGNFLKEIWTKAHVVYSNFVDEYTIDIVVDLEKIESRL